MVSLRLSAEARHILRARAAALGVSQAAVLEVLLRQAPAPPEDRKADAACGGPAAEPLSSSA